MNHCHLSNGNLLSHLILGTDKSLDLSKSIPIKMILDKFGDRLNKCMKLAN